MIAGHAVAGLAVMNDPRARIAQTVADATDGRAPPGVPARDR